MYDLTIAQTLRINAMGKHVLNYVLTDLVPLDELQTFNIPDKYIRYAQKDVMLKDMTVADAAEALAWYCVVYRASPWYEAEEYISLSRPAWFRYAEQFPVFHPIRTSSGTPLQPINDNKFEANPIIEALLATSTLDLNAIAGMGYDSKHMQQLFTLLGWSVDALLEISYIDEPVAESLDE